MTNEKLIEKLENWIEFNDNNAEKAMEVGDINSARMYSTTSTAYWSVLQLINVNN